MASHKSISTAFGSGAMLVLEPIILLLTITSCRTLPQQYVEGSGISDIEDLDDSLMASHPETLSSQGGDSSLIDDELQPHPDRSQPSASSSQEGIHQPQGGSQGSEDQSPTSNPQTVVDQLSDTQLLALLGSGIDDGLTRCENEQHVCVPYYLCREESIITDGAGLIDIRFGSHKDQPSDESLTHSECPNYMDVCCSALIEKENTTEPAYQPKCGRRNEFGVKARIVGFNDGQTQFGEFPWMAAVLRKKVIAGHLRSLYVCGGALIHPQVVLTAAHCVSQLEATKTKVRLGEWDTKYVTEFYNHVDVNVSLTKVHPEFNSRNLRNDIALLFLEESVELQEHIDTLCLPDPSENLDWSECVATGWGKDRFNNGSYQTVLKQVDLERVNSSRCEESLRTTRLGQYFKLHDSFTCAGAIEDQIPDEYHRNAQVEANIADTCTGDGGSPLACRSPSDPHRYVHGGIVAWGIGCGEKGIPGVYADPGKFIEWIDESVTSYLHLES